MKKLSFSLVMIFMFFSAAFAQDLPRIAVYVTGDMPDNNKRVFGPELLASLVNSGRYSGIERPNVFFAEVESKRTTEFGGTINDSQLSELGREFGVDYVCIADVVPAFGIYRVEVRIVDAKTAQTVVAGESNSSLKTFDELTRVLRAIVVDMFGEQAALVRESESVPVAFAPESHDRASAVAVAPAPVAAESKWPPKAAVYITGLNPLLGNALSKAVTSALMKAKIYEGIESIDQHITGTPDDGQIIQAGKKAGVHFVFVVNVSGQINVRIIDVDLATEMAKVSLDGKISSPIDAGRVAASIVNFILKSGPKPPPGYIATAPVASDGRKAKGTAKGSRGRNRFNPNINYGSFTDTRDGQSYRTVVIGGKTWMADNLNYQTNNSRCYRNDASNCDAYGRLYTWDAAKNACPVDWRLPDDNDWNNLVSAVGHRNAATKLKSQAGWKSRGNGTDEFGFSALPGGYRDTGGSFRNVGYYGFWWSATETDASLARYRYMDYDFSYVYSSWLFKSFAFSVRCLRD